MNTLKLAIAAIRQSVDLRRVVEDDLGAPIRGGRWACPIHGGDGPNFAVDEKRWKCWKCGASGDVFDYLARRKGLTVAEAAGWLDPSGTFGRAAVGRAYTPRSLSPVASATKVPPPFADRYNESVAGGKTLACRDPAWQAAVDRIVREAETTLWSPEGRQALGWLHARGLLDATIKRFRLGFVPHLVESEPIDSLGRDDRGEPRRVRARRGIVIPWVRPGSWYAVVDDALDDPGHRWTGCNVRQLPPGDLCRPVTGSKYLALAGSERGHGYPWPEAAVPGDPALVCEGEFDSLIGWQEAGWIANVVTFGGASQSQLHPDARAFLASCPDWLLLFDHDDAGDNAARGMIRSAPHRCRRLYLPGGANDLNDLHRCGGSVLGWLRSEYSRFGWPWPHERHRSRSADGVSR
jgi:hypothetical protein